MQHHSRVSRLGGAGLLALALLAPLASQASSSLAIEMGCYNCHGAYPRADAPSFRRLAAKYAKHKGDAAQEQRAVDKLRQGEPLEHIPAHERLSPATAQMLMHWLFKGAP